MERTKLNKGLLVALVGVMAAALLVLTACGGGSSASSSSSSSSDSSASASSASASASSASSSSSAAAEAGDYTLVKDGTLTVGLAAEYPPFEYMEGGEVVGFDAAMMKEVGDRLGLDVEFNNQGFDTLITAVAGGTSLDVACSAITITDEREQEVDFSDSYYDSNLSIVVLKDSGFEAADVNAAKELLNGQPVGGQSGSSGEAWAQENLADSPYTPQQDTPDLLQQLRVGNIVAAVYDQPVAEVQVAGEYTDCEILCVIPTGEQYGIAVNKANAQLTADINSALASMKADGTIDKLLEEYF